MNDWSALTPHLDEFEGRLSPAERIGHNGNLERMRAMTLGAEVPTMATYTLVFTDASGRQSSNLAEFKDQASIIRDAREALGEDIVSIAIGRGAAGGVEWLGAWDWCGGSPVWSPEEGE